MIGIDWMVFVVFVRWENCVRRVGRNVLVWIIV